MRGPVALCFLFLSSQAFACETKVCLADPEALSLTEVITFESTISNPGPGRNVDILLVMNGAVFGERFAGQTLAQDRIHDSLSGAALAPLTVLPGAAGQNLSVVYVNGNNILNGYGSAGFPKRQAQGEGAISFLFDEDQSALAFQIRGGESGRTEVVFLARNGAELARLNLPQVGEHDFGFIRADGNADIAGVLLTNEDPQGIALDNVRFGHAPDLS